MSKFFADESDGSSDHDSAQSDSDAKKIQNQDEKQKMNKRVQIMEEIESSEEEEKHVVVSEKDKRIKHMRQVIESIKNKQNINDFIGLQTEFEELNKELERGRKMFEKEGGIPRFYIRVLCQLENFLLGVTAEAKKKFSQTNNKAYNTLKQRIKKHNLGFKVEIDQFLENPVDSEAERLQEKQDQRKQVEKQGDEEEDDDEEDEVDEEQGDDEDEDDKYLLQSNDPMVRRRYWLKKVKDDEDLKEDNYEQRIQRQKIRLEQKQQEKQIDYEIKFQIKEGEDIKIDYSNEGVNKTLLKIVESRGRSSGQHENIYICEKLIVHFVQKQDFKRALEILVITIQLQIDQAKSEGTIFITRKSWHNIYQNLLHVVALYQDQGLKFDSLNSYSKYDSGLKKQKFLDLVQLNFSTLETELNKAFLGIEFNTTDYAERLSDLYQLIFLAQKLLNMFKNDADTLNIAKYLELCYFLSQPLIDRIKNSVQEDSSPTKQATAKPQIIFSDNILDITQELIKNIYNGCDEEQQKRASLYRAYNLALHGRYQDARDIFQSTFTNETIQSQKLTMQVHYNRTILVLGLAAFKQGLIWETHQLLGEFIITRDRLIRDLVAQNYTRAASETEAAKYNVPYHMSLNLELFETVYYICAMLLEMPNINQDPYEDQQKIISKKFRQFYNHYEPQPFNNITDNFREIIYHSSKNLSIGNWRECYTQLLNLQIWTKIHNSDQVQVKLQQRVKEQSLKCYLINFKSAIACINLKDLSEYFELTLDAVKSNIYKMIYYKELNAKIEGGINLRVVFRKAAENSFDRNTVTLIEKISVLTKTNEKILDAKYGSYGFQQSEKEAAEYNKTQKSKSKKKPTSKYYKTKNIQKQKRV